MPESTAAAAAGRLPPMLRAALLTLFILIVLPAAANAACRQAPVADVWYDTPALQVWVDEKGFVTCVRATGVEHVYRSTDPEVGAGARARARRPLGPPGALHGLRVRRQSRSSRLGLDLYDAQTGAVVPGSGWPVPGGYVDTGADGIVARYFDGRTEVLDPAPAGEDLNLVFQGRRVYWQTATGPRTALLNLPQATAPATKRLRARKMTNCTPRPGANLVARYRRIVVTRKGKSVHVCFNKRTTPIGNATAVERVNQADIAYARPGYVGYLDAHRGKQRELPSAGGPLAADAFIIAAVDRNGVLRVWNTDRKRPQVITRGRRLRSGGDVRRGLLARRRRHAAGAVRALVPWVGRRAMTSEEDERWIVIDGRRWRRSDPSLPEERRKELVSELMSARSAVGWAKRKGDATAERAARDRVHAAKVALGERGPKWWDSDGGEGNRTPT